MNPTDQPVQTKTCKCCQQDLPLSSFNKHRSSRDRLNYNCKPCKRKQERIARQKNPVTLANWKASRNRYHARWAQRYPDKLIQYQAAQRAKVKSTRPQIEPCQCGNTDKFRWRLGWICVPCSATKASQSTKARKKRAEYRRRCRRLESQHGSAIASAFLELGETHISLRRLVGHLMPGKTRAHIERLIYLNKLSGLPILNSNWSCVCGEKSEDPSFFDIDHIHPRHRGGRGKRDNLQILCPNCHRRKTLLQARSKHLKRLDSPAQDHWQAGTGTTIDEREESSTPSTASTTSLTQP